MNVKISKHYRTRIKRLIKISAVMLMFSISATIIIQSAAAKNETGLLDNAFQLLGGVYEVSSEPAAFTANAQTTLTPVAGGLDLDYKAGVQNPNFLSNQDGRVRAIVIQPDGKHIIAGNFETANSTGRSSIARFNADGTIDESFDTGVGLRGQGIIDVALQPDGKILVGGSFVGFTNSSGVFQRNYILRLNTDGSLDETFNPGQSVNGQVKAVLLQPDGKVLIGGDFTTIGGVSRRGIARLNSDGSLDTSLNPGTGITGTFETMALQADGKIVVGGFMSNYNGTTVNHLFRIDANGALDSSFNIGTGPNSNINAVKVQPDGKILVGGQFTTFNGQAGKWVVRLNSDGSRDNFLEGTVCNSLCTLPNPPQQFSVLANGQIYISSIGTSNNAFPSPTAWFGSLLRYNADGSRDTSFNPPAETIAPNAPPFNRHAVQADGSVIGTAGRFLSGTPEFAYSHVRRLTSAGNLDATYTPLFGDIVGPFSGGSFVADVALQSDGKLLAAGNFSAANNQLRRDIARFNADGSLDTSFNFQTPTQTIFKVLPLPDGKIIACGAVALYSNPPEPTRYGVVRLNSNGTVDTTFVGTGAFGGNTAVYDAALQPDGKIVIVGRFNSYNGVNREGIARLHPDGSLDTSFNPGTGFGQTSGSAEPRELKILPDGKIVVVGAFSSYNGTPRSGLVRILSDGALDTTFTPSGMQAAAYVAVAYLPNGQLLIGSSVLQRVNTDGSADTSFTGVPQIVSGGNIEAIHILSNGRIMIGGTFETATTRRSGVARVLPNGGFDLSFGNNLRGADVGITGFGDIAVDEVNNHVYFGGTFYSYNNFGRGSLARVFLGSPGSTLFDYDGDGRADVSVFRPSAGAWFLNRSSQGFTGVQFGIATDRLAPADFDGDGKTDLAVFRDGNWYSLRSSDGAFTAVQFGAAGDVPMPADFDGDGRADPAVFRNGTWYLLRSQAGFTGIQFGASGDVPVAADYDGDGRADVAVYRGGNWFILKSSDGAFTAVQFGIAGDKPVPADYDGDGRADQAVYRNGVWYLNRSTAGFTGVQFGIASDVPAPADYDGDGRADQAVFRDGAWYLLQTTAGFTGLQFGAAGDKPTPAAFVP